MGDSRDMGLKVYLAIAAIVFLASTTGSDVVAAMSIAGEPLAGALREDLYWARVEFGGTLLLLAPFVVVACVCGLVEKHARTRSALFIFASAMLALLYFYFRGYQAAQYAALQKMWTAATLSVGLLPFTVGVLVVFAVMAAGVLAVRFDRRISA